MNRTISADNLVFGEDAYFKEAAQFAVKRGQLSIGALQRQFKVQFKLNDTPFSPYRFSECIEKTISRVIRSI